MIKKVLLFFFLVMVVTVALPILFVQFSDTPRYAVEQVKINIDYTTILVAEGKRIALTICFHCHYNASTETLAGRKHGNPKEVGDFFSGNITQDSSTGIGAWSDGELLYFLRTGIKPDGEFIWDMPKYPLLSNEDVFSIISFLRSNDPLVRATNFKNPEPKFSLLIKAVSWVAFRPAQFPRHEIPPPDTIDMLSFGKYLATAKFSCFACHSGMSHTNDYNFPERSKSYFAGENLHANEQGDPIYSANLTPDMETGIGSWSEERFIQTVKFGIKADGSTVKDPMVPFPLLKDKEIQAIYAYLKTIPPIRQSEH